MVSQSETTGELKKARLPSCKVGICGFLLWLFVCVGGFTASIVLGINQIKTEAANSSANTVGTCVLTDLEEQECLYKCFDAGGHRICRGQTWLYTAVMESKCGTEKVQGYDERCEGTTSPRSDFYMLPPEPRDILEEYECYLPFNDCEAEFTFEHEGDNFLAGVPQIIVGILGILACPCICGCLWVKYWKQKEIEYEEAKQEEVVSNTCDGQTISLKNQYGNGITTTVHFE